MAFALSSIKVVGTEVSEPVTKRFVQVVQFNITALAADVLLDIGASTAGALGTFWTAAGGTEVGADALEIWRRIQVKGDSILSVSVPQIQDTKAKIASGGTVATGQFKSVTTLPGFAITQFAGEGATTVTLTMQILLKAGALPEDNNPS
jgi:hypothetical protein